MRTILLVAFLLLSAVPAVSAGPIDATDCDDRDPASLPSSGCSASVSARDPNTGSGAACWGGSSGSGGHAGGGHGGCGAGGPAGFAVAACSEERFQTDPSSEDVRRSCAARVSDRSGGGTGAACGQGEHREASGHNGTWFECFLTGVYAGGSDDGSARNATFTATATLSDGSTMDCTGMRITNPDAPKLQFPGRCMATGDLDGDGDPDVAAQCSDGGAGTPDGCRTATKWKIYAPLPSVFSRGACAADTAGASAGCAWDGVAGFGLIYHSGLPPEHHNVVIADLDRDGALDLMVTEDRGNAFVYASPAGCMVYGGAGVRGGAYASTCLG